MIQTLLDSGPLVAFYSTTDTHHQWAFQQLSALSPPLLTCEAVLTEACFLLHRAGVKPTVLIRAIQQEILHLALKVDTEALAIEVLMEKYADAPMSLADACLVRMSELHEDCRVLTVDAHFKRYRRFGRHLIPLLAPW
jgi:predicted nucleic acid-binding protein